MKIEIIDDQNLWDGFLLYHAPVSGGFLHSWGWGEFQKKQGKSIYRLGFFEDKLTGIAVLIENHLPFGLKYFYIPRGPIIASDDVSYAQILIELKNFASQNNAVFLRVEPAELKKEAPLCAPLSRGIQITRHLQPENTLILNLVKSEEELLGAMHEKTRYNIGLAKRKSVIVHTTGAEQLDDFVKLLNETTARDAIKMYGRNYFKNLLETHDRNLETKLWLANFEGKPIAAAINVYFGKTATYLFGASSDKYRNAMAPHLLQWMMIQDAKARGFNYYDFW